MTKQVADERKLLINAQKCFQLATQTLRRLLLFFARRLRHTFNKSAKISSLPFGALVPLADLPEPSKN